MRCARRRVSEAARRRGGRRLGSSGPRGGGLTHVDRATGLPAMVDVSAKPRSARTATAVSRVAMPPHVVAELRGGARGRDAGARELHGPKGPVLATAVVAGTAAVKMTPALIPFCHPLAVEGCRFETDIDDAGLTIRCTVSVSGRTGVEMEALTGASVAALTVYDMCKALSHDMEVSTRLLSKRGGRSGDVGPEP